MTNVVKFPDKNKFLAGLSIGQAFIHDNTLFMKVAELSINATRLETGKLYDFTPQLSVQPVDLEIIVK